MKSIKTKFFIEKCFSGINFIALTIFYVSLEHNWNIWWLDVILGVIIVINFLFQCVGIPRMHFEPVDEMTRNHELRAQAATYNTLSVLITALGLLCLINKQIRSFIFSISISWMYLFIVLGILQIIEYIIFLQIERGDDLIE